MSTNEINNRAKELKKLKAKAEQIADQIAAIEDEIKAEMETQGIEEMTAGVFKIRWVKVTSTRFDSAGFKKAMPELYGRFTKISETRRFSIA